MDVLNEGDRVGIMRTAKGDLLFSINGESQGIATVDIDKPVWAVVSLYGKCAQVSICSQETPTNVGATAVAAASAVAIVSATYDIDNFVPNFPEPVSTRSSSLMSGILNERRPDEYIPCGKQYKSMINN